MTFAIFLKRMICSEKAAGVIMFLSIQFESIRPYYILFFGELYYWVLLTGRYLLV